MAGNLILFILLSLLIEVCLLSLLLDREIFGLCSTMLRARNGDRELSRLHHLVDKDTHPLLFLW